MRCRARRQLIGLVLLFGVGVAASGCSLVFVDAPPPLPRRPDFDCSSTYAMPALDTGISLLGLVFLAMRGSGTLPTGGLSPSAQLVVGFSSALIFGVSAVDGYQQVYACREALEESEPAPEVPQHHRPPPSRPAPPEVAPQPGPPALQEPDSSDAP
jgi:hypothetical protein